MSEDTRGAEAAAPAVSQAQLQQAEAYVEAEEGVVNRLFGWAGRLVTSIAVAMSLFHLVRRHRRRVAVHRLPHHRHPAAALRARRVRADAELPLVPDVDTVPRSHPLV